MEFTGLPFEVEASNYEEDMTKPLSPPELVKELSKGKAQEVAARHPNEEVIVIGADSIVVFEDKRLGKPHTPEKAREMLTMMRGQTVQIFSGYTVIDCSTGKVINEAKSSDVVMRNYSDEEMEWYIATDEPLDKAGAFAVQLKGALLVEKIDGDLTNMIGLPLYDVMQALQELGFRVW